ncbi:porin family protein [Vibrio hangzhouensis]|uniref:Opacity protein n=1 Tax=Vibrio hangzhouensis TaxID=462991 RepID=A0A1H5VCT2_9VIBR|nr:porin family protein [Vibrio hangzhouensis]SEF85162.1 Opacity protein [Vibrio hangzhouensis]
MKKLVLAVAISAMSASAFANTEFTGHRVGLGASGLEFSESGYNWDLGTGLKLEYGYDFNHIFGLNVSYAWNQDDVSLPDYIGNVDYRARTFKIDSDIGYAFELENLWLKPYGAIGLAYVNDEVETQNNGTFSGSESTLFLGLGVRAQLNMGLYADLRYDMPSFSGVDADYLSFTLGYRF